MWVSFPLQGPGARGPDDRLRGRQHLGPQGRPLLLLTVLQAHSSLEGHFTVAKFSGSGRNNHF
jgi:hypothetical protein